MHTRTSESGPREGDGMGKTGSKRGIILILAGLAITGIAAGWDWLRKLPKD